MIRNQIVIILVVALEICAVRCAAAVPVTPVVNDVLTLLPAGSIHFSGPIGDAIQTCQRGRIRGQDISLLIQPFVDREEYSTWRSEFWGKWFTSAALAYRYQPEPDLRRLLDRAVQELLATQTPDGYIGSYKRSAETGGWDVWGRKYVLLGLLSYYDITGDRNALDAACREADYTLGQIGPGKANIVKLGIWTGMAASSILEPMVLLYQRTGEKRYLEFAQYIVNQWSEPGGPDLVRKALDGVTVFKMFPGPAKVVVEYQDGGQSKAYEMMSCYEGLLELYRFTGEPTYLEAAQKVFHDIDSTEITLLGSGSSLERWCNGRMRQTEALQEWMETCVTVTWMKFASQLLRLTGDPDYADHIEHSAYNSLLGAQKHDGTWWSHYSPPVGPRIPAPDHCGIHMQCCVANGPRALMLLPALAVMRDRSGPVVQFYESGTATVPLDSGKKVQLQIQGDYPRRSDVEILVQPEAEEPFTLSLRIPTWSRNTKVEINGQEASGIESGGYARLARTWKPGDRVRIVFDMAVRIVNDPGGSRQVALVRGPVVLALDQRIAQPSVGITTTTVQKDALGTAVEVHDGLPEGIQWAIDVPCVTADGKVIHLRMCDYASAGNRWSQDNCFRTWLPQPLTLETMPATGEIWKLRTQMPERPVE